jgi:hypothetical protein
MVPPLRSGEGSPCDSIPCSLDGTRRCLIGRERRRGWVAFGSRWPNYVRASMKPHAAMQPWPSRGKSAWVLEAGPLMDRLPERTRGLIPISACHRLKPIRKKPAIFYTTPDDGYLGSWIDEERSEMRYVMRIAELRESSNF